MTSSTSRPSSRKRPRRSCPVTTTVPCTPRRRWTRPAPWKCRASWAGAAHNPRTNVLYVPSFTIPFGIKIKKENNGVYDYTGTWAGVGGPQGLPLFKPPFSSVTAIDMNTGEHLWRIPAGKGPVDHPALKDLKLDRLGVPRESFIALTDNVLFLAPEGTNSVL